MNVTTIGIDLAKHTFSLHGVDSRGKLVFRKTLSRAKLLPFLGSLPPCLIGMEACSGAHYWGRELSKLGHRVGIMAPKFVAAYRKSGKNYISDVASRPVPRRSWFKNLERATVIHIRRLLRWRTDCVGGLAAAIDLGTRVAFTVQWDRLGDVHKWEISAYRNISRRRTARERFFAA